MVKFTRTQEDQGFKFVTISYVAALGVLAFLVVCTHFLTDAIIAEEGDTARIVNIAGRQRMLSQRAALLALELSRMTDAARLAPLEGKFANTLNEMEFAHHTLRNEAVDIGSRANKKRALTEVYRNGPEQLEARIKDFLTQGRSFLQVPAGQRAEAPELARMLEAAHQSLLMAFEKAVTNIQAESEHDIVHLRKNMGLMLGVVLATLVAEALFIFRPLFKRLKAAQAKLLEVAMSDPLTGSMNRRFLMESAKREMLRTRRTGQPLAVMMLDIDHFKTINDTWGHGTGDEAIVVLARTLSGAIRGSDLLGRMGGDEFALLLPGADTNKALTVAKKLRDAVAAAEIKVGSSTLHMTISLGVAELMATDESVTTAFDRADQALYQAKQSGRNRACSWTEELPPQSMIINERG